jgi:hypothetical protein
MTIKLAEVIHHSRVQLFNCFLEFGPELPVASALAVVALDMPLQWFGEFFVHLLPLMFYLIQLRGDTFIACLKVIIWSFLTRLQILQTLLMQNVFTIRVLSHGFVQFGIHFVVFFFEFWIHFVSKFFFIFCFVPVFDGLFLGFRDLLPL